MSVFKRIRFLIEYFYGYSVYYLWNGFDYIGFCTVSSGKNKRYWFADKNDIIFGPYFIKKEYRGRGYSTLLIYQVLYCAGINYNNAYDYINANNIPSIRVTERLGGKKIFNVSINILTRKMKKTSNGQYGIYRISKEERKLNEKSKCDCSYI